MKQYKHEKHLQQHHRLRKKFSRSIRVLGPGVITGAADDDPSGIATYSQAGAGMGYGLLWMIPAMFPMLLAVQGTCSRIGAVTGRGLAAILRDHFSKKVLFFAVGLAVTANIINIGADLGAMAAALQLLFPALPFMAAAIGFTVLILALVIFVKYKTYARILKWLAVVLFAYPITAFIVGQPWPEVFMHTLTPQLSLSDGTIYLIVGLLGTTISPYLFFWDTSEVIEDEIASKRLGIFGKKPPKITKHFLRSVRIDNFVGMSLAAVTAWFIMLTCATVLFSQGTTEINTAADAARAIEPLVAGFPNAGLVAKIIFSVGIIGLGLLAVPVLAGSSSYAISESFGWREGLYRRMKKAEGFYGIIIAATVVGLLINFSGINPIQALIFSAVFNGIAAVPLLAMIAIVGRNEKIMGEYRNGKLVTSFVWLAFAVMGIAALVLIGSLFV
ncbi:divalent metal cation transporter [Candidatus Saccharibacteria bacterium]|nr:divalent metal cation transporter [Candidatus Saccharibacteria bacterium]